jgi:acetyl esterase/lipase
MLTAHAWLGAEPAVLFVAGDSAGGGLAAALALAWAAAGLQIEPPPPPPICALVLFSPWLDLTVATSGEVIILHTTLYVFFSITKEIQFTIQGGVRMTSPLTADQGSGASYTEAALDHATRTGDPVFKHNVADEATAARTGTANKVEGWGLEVGQTRAAITSLALPHPILVCSHG